MSISHFPVPPDEFRNSKISIATSEDDDIDRPAPSSSSQPKPKRSNMIRETVKVDELDELGKRIQQEHLTSQQRQSRTFDGI